LTTSDYPSLPTGELYRDKMNGEGRILAERLDMTFDANPFRGLQTRFMVAATGARVGTHLLCQKLTQYGAYVNEFFNWPQIFATCEKENIRSLQGYVELALKRFSSEGVFGVKGEANILVPLVEAGEFPANAADWKFVYLDRKDTVMQAVSKFKAELTGAYVAASQPTREVTDDDYDGERIRGIQRWNDRMAATWEETFALFGIKPMRVHYEELSADPDAIAAQAAAFIGLKGAPVRDRRPVMLKQADELNERWAARYREEFQEG
jgi:LPS sulfotransferase NodH